LKRRKNAHPKKKATPRMKLRLPDLDHSKAAVLNSLRSPESQRGYRHSIDEFIASYCSEPRLSFSKTVVTRYRIYLESRLLAAGTINGRLAAVRRVKGAKKLGVRLGNWLTATEARILSQFPDAQSLKAKRDRALLAILLGCGRRLGNSPKLDFDHLQRRDEPWAIVDLVGKGGHIRTVPVPD
jgi:integrase